jgi:hypothetical protein
MLRKSDPRPPRFEVGDWVKLPFGVRMAVAQVIEQRGPLSGPERRHIYRIRIDREETEPTLLEMPEDMLEPASPPTGRPGDGPCRTP